MSDWLFFGGLGAAVATSINAILVACFVWIRKNQDKRFWESKE